MKGKVDFEELLQEVEREITTNGPIVLYVGSFPSDRAGGLRGLSFGVGSATKRDIAEALLQLVGYELRWVKKGEIDG